MTNLPPSHAGKGGIQLPVDNLIYDLALFGSRLPKVDSCSFDALMPHEISEKSNVIAAIKEALRKTMSKRVRIYNDGINFITDGQFFKLPGDPTGSDSLSVFVQKNEAAFLLFLCQPRKGFILKSFGDVYSSEFSAFGI